MHGGRPRRPQATHGSAHGKGNEGGHGDDCGDDEEDTPEPMEEMGSAGADNVFATVLGRLPAGFALAGSKDHAASYVPAAFDEFDTIRIQHPSVYENRQYYIRFAPTSATT